MTKCYYEGYELSTLLS